jgi:hypothetical protein
MQKWPAPAAAPASSIGLETDFESSLSSACVSMCRGDRRAIGTGAYSP